MGYKTKIIPQYSPAGTATTKVTIATMVGNPGPQGPTGSRWREGSGAPADSLGDNFDFYHDRDSGDVYQKEGGTYGSPYANITGPQGPQGDTGPQGYKGWSPTFAVVSDGSRRVLQVNDWVGGAGTKPATGDYVGATGLVSAIADAVDIRGPIGVTDPTALAQAGAANLDGIVWSDAAGAWEVGPSVAAKLLAKEVRRGKEPVVLHDFANDAHHTINPTDATGLELDLDRIWTFNRDSATWAWVEGPNGTPVVKKLTIDEAVLNAIDPATGEKLGYRARVGFTNSLLWNRNLDDPVWVGVAQTTQDQVGIDGVANTAWTVTDSATDDTEEKRHDLPIPDDSNPIAVVWYVGKDSDTSRFPAFRVKLEGGSLLTQTIILNTTDGTFAIRDGDGSTVVIDLGDFWQVVSVVTNDSTGNTNLEYGFAPAFNSDGGVTKPATSTGSIVYDFGGVYLNSSIAGPPIETEGTTVSTAADDASEPLPPSCQDGFVWVMHARVPEPNANNQYIGGIGDETNNNRIELLFASDLRAQWVVRAASSTVLFTSLTSSLSPGDDVKIAIRAESGRYAASVNGDPVATFSASEFPSALPAKLIGKSHAGGNYLNSTIALDYLDPDPSAWTDADLQNASAL